jgi:phosphotransferase system HPr-like phosphotransfer protein
MKSTNRIHRNAVTKPANSQAEITFRADARNLRDAAENLSDAVDQADTLLELLEAHLDWREHRLGSDFTGEIADKFNHRIFLLSHHARGNMKKATLQIMNLAFNKNTEVQS